MIYFEHGNRHCQCHIQKKKEQVLYITSTPFHLLNKSRINDQTEKKGIVCKFTINIYIYDYCSILIDYLQVAETNHYNAQFENFWQLNMSNNGLE